MIATNLTPNSSTLSLTIPPEMVGKEVNVIVFAVEDEAKVIERLSEDLYKNEANVYIPQWQKDLVLAEKKRVEDDPFLLVSWERIRREFYKEEK